MLCFLNRFT